MSEPGAPGPTTSVDDRPPGSRTVLVTFLGAVVRRQGDWLPIGGTVDLMTRVGLDAASVRTAVFRLKRRGWLASQTRSGVRGYALTPTALAVLAEGDELVWHARKSADLAAGWCVVNFSVPESERSRRHALRAHLGALGFGNVGTAMWIAPAAMRGAAERAIDELGLTPYSAVFVGPYVAGQDLGALVRRSWDLAGIDAHYVAFLERFTGADATAASPEAAFATYLRSVDHWRTLPFRDPGLPRELLPPDWHAGEAARLFTHLVARLEPRALSHAASRWPGAPTTPPTPR